MSSVTDILKLLWGGCALVVLVVAGVAFDGKPNSDADVFLAYGMLFLAFPIGLLVALIAGGIGYVLFTVFGYVVSVSYATIAIGWAIFALAGYWQWFWLLPLLLRKFRRPQSTTAPN